MMQARIGVVIQPEAIWPKTLNFIARCGNPGWCSHIAKSPSGHCKSFTKAIYGHRSVSNSLKAAYAGVFIRKVDVFINFI